MVLLKNGPLLGLVLALAGVVDCGHDDSNWDLASSCNLDASALCEANANCSVATGETTAATRPAFVSACLEQAKVRFNCATATFIKGSPNECESDLVRLPCTNYVAGMGVVGMGLPVPAACQTVFTAPADAGPTSDAGPAQ